MDWFSSCSRDNEVKRMLPAFPEAAKISDENRFEVMISKAQRFLIHFYAYM